MKRYWIAGTAIACMLVLAVVVQRLTTNVSVAVPVAVASPSHRPQVGEKAQLCGPPVTVIGTDPHAYEQYNQAVAHGDRAQANDLTGSGQICPADPEAHVLVLARTRDYLRVRLLDGIDTGMEGWLPARYVQQNEKIWSRP